MQKNPQQTLKNHSLCSNEMNLTAQKMAPNVLLRHGAISAIIFL